MQTPITSSHTYLDPRDVDLPMSDITAQQNLAYVQAMEGMMGGIRSGTVRIQKLEEDNHKKDLLIAELKEKIHQMEEQNPAQAELTLAEGCKTSLIKVMLALYSLGFVVRRNGSGAPTQKEWMTAVGQWLGVDLSNYSQLMSVAKANMKADSESFVGIFDQMKVWIEKYTQR